MKKLFVVSILVLVLFTPSFGQKLMDEIYVGMPKKEFKALIKTNKDKYVIKTGIVNLKISGNYDENNLIKSISFNEGISLDTEAPSTMRKINSIKQYLVDKGCKVIEENNRVDYAKNIMKMVMGNSFILERDSVLYGLNFISDAKWYGNKPAHIFTIWLEVAPINYKEYFRSFNK